MTAIGKAVFGCHILGGIVTKKYSLSATTSSKSYVLAADMVLSDESDDSPSGRDSWQGPMNSPQEPSKDAPFPAPMSAGESRLRAIFQDSDNVFWVTNPQGVPVPSECPTWLNYTGQTVAELLQDWTLALHPEDRTLAGEAWQTAVKNRVSFRTEYRLRRRDGTYRHFMTLATPVLAAQGEILEWVGFCTDISHRKAVEETMQRSAQTSEILRKSILALNSCADLDSALNTLLGHVICLSGMDGGGVYTIEGANARLRHHYGLPEGLAQQVTLRPLTTPYVQNALANPDDIFDVLSRFPAHQSALARYGIQHFYCIPLLSEKQPFGFINLCSNRAEAPKAADLELIRILTWETESLLTRLSVEQRYRSVLTAMAEGVVVQLADGSIMDCNPSAERILGLSRDQIMGRKSVDPRWHSVRENGEPFPGEQHPAMISLRTGKPAHNVVMGLHLPDRSQRWININAEPIFHHGEAKPYAVVATFGDITERIQMVQSLQDSEGQLRRVGDNLPQGMMYQLLSHADGRRQFLYVSAGVEKLHGVTVQQVLDDACVLYGQILEADRDYVAKKEIECSKTLGSFSAQVSFRRPDNEVRWMQLSSAPTQLADGSILWDGLEIDITEAKRVEEHLRQTQKMEGIGHLAGGVAHEFNNILAVLMPGLAMVKESVANPEAQETLQQMQSLMQRAADLVKQMLAFSRQSVLHREPYDLAADIPAQIKLLKRLLGERITVEYSFPKDLPWINADKNLIAQALLNLCVNARDAMKGQGHLRISLDAVVVTAEAVKDFTNVHAGEFLCLSVADQGCGMSRRVLEHLFEPFFSTKPVGEGTGLGLATVQGVVQQHHGWVKVESLVGVGTTFRIYLPATAPQTVTAPPPPKEMATGHGTILVVDDEPALRLVMRKLLVRMGYVVLEAAHGAEALTLWEKHRAEIQLVFTDMVMPGELTGLQLAELVLKDKPTVKVIITSGYNQQFFDLEELERAKIIYLPKPCEPVMLTQIIRRCLEPAA